MIFRQLQRSDHSHHDASRPNPPTQRCIRHDDVINTPDLRCWQDVLSPPAPSRSRPRHARDAFSLVSRSQDSGRWPPRRAPTPQEGLMTYMRKVAKAASTSGDTYKVVARLRDGAHKERCTPKTRNATATDKADTGQTQTGRPETQTRTGTRTTRQNALL